jgi:plasmid stabilization system protein ParE
LQVVYLRTALRDMAWFRTYCQDVFREGAKSARYNLKLIDSLNAEHPLTGRQYDDAGSRHLPVLRTPFLFVYRIADNRIEVLRLQDQRRPW